MGIWLEVVRFFLKALDRIPDRERDLLVNEYLLDQIPYRSDTSLRFDSEAARSQALARANAGLARAVAELGSVPDLADDEKSVLSLVQGWDVKRALASVAAAVEKKDPLEPVDEMDALYDELAVLTADENAESDVGLQERIDATWSRLRELQEKEAQRFQEEFEASLSMPLDAGARILAKARALRKEIEDLS